MGLMTMSHQTRREENLRDFEIVIRTSKRENYSFRWEVHESEGPIDIVDLIRQHGGVHLDDDGSYELFIPYHAMKSIEIAEKDQ